MLKTFRVERFTSRFPFFLPRSMKFSTIFIHRLRCPALLSGAPHPDPIKSSQTKVCSFEPLCWADVHWSEGRVRAGSFPRPLHIRLQIYGHKCTVVSSSGVRRTTNLVLLHITDRLIDGRVSANAVGRDHKNVSESWKRATITIE